MKTCVFCLQRPAKHTTVASNRIAQWLAETLDVPLHWNNDIMEEHWDTVILVNGAPAFCHFREAISHAITNASNLIWVQNDYAILHPDEKSTAQSPWRRAFVERLERGAHPLDYWTTIPVRASRTPRSRYINWNMLTWDPLPISVTLRPNNGKLLYYGAYRPDREDAFLRYFRRPVVPTVVSSYHHKFDRFGDVEKPGPLRDRRSFYSDINQYGLGLYLQDASSKNEYHSPANRFYEMLSARLPMVFDYPAIETMERAGYDVSDYVVTNVNDVAAAMEKRDSIQRRQMEEWGSRDYRTELTDSVKKAWEDYAG